MRYTSLEQVKQSGSVLPEGIDFFIENPMKFIQLVKEDHALAKKFADHFSSTQVEAILSSAYGTDSVLKMSVDKFFSALLELAYQPKNIIFHESLSDLQMQMAMWGLGLKLYDIDKYHPDGIYAEKNPKGERLPYVYVYASNNGDNGKRHTPIFWLRHSTDNPFNLSPDNYRGYTRNLKSIYQEATRDAKVITLILDICKAMLKKLQTPNILDPEFKNERWTGEPQTNRIFPALSPALKANLKIEVSSVLSKIFQFTSHDIVLRELARPDKETSVDYLKIIIQHLPMSKKVYNQVHLAVSKVAGGPKGYSNLRRILDSFNFDILEALAKVKSKNPYALQFYEIGELCLQEGRHKNPMLDKYPASAPKYEELRQSKFEITSEASSSSSCAYPILTGFNRIIASAPPALPDPPAYQPSPAYNPNFSADNKKVI